MKLNRLTQLKQMRSCILSAKTKPETEILIASVRVKLKKTTKRFLVPKYNLNSISDEL